MNPCFSATFKRSLLLIFFFTCFFVKAQTPAPTIYQIPVQGKIVDDGDAPIPGATIQVKGGSKVVATTTTGGDGKYTFQVPINADYIVTVSGPGMVTKKFMISARGIPPERAQEPFGAIEATVGLWKKVDGVDYSALNQPANKYYYNPDKQKLEYDKEYLQQMLGLIEQIREQEKNLEKNKAAAEKNYQAAIKKADILFAKKDWANAKATYTEASGYKPAEAYPKTQMAAIDAAMKAEAEAKAKADADAKAKADADAKAKGELEANYLAAIKKGDDAFKAKDWATAKAGYNAALAIKPAEKYPKDQLAAIDKAIADEKAKADADAKSKAELEAKYAAAVKKGDDAFAKKDWATAKGGYTEATGLKPAEKYPKDQLALVDKAIADEAAAKAKADADAKAKAELDAKYAAAVKKGDDAFKTKDWSTAKAGYNEAHGLKAAEKYPTDQLALIEKTIADEAAKAKADADAKSKAEIEAKYAAAIKKGDDAFKTKDWTNSKAGYTEALGIKAGEKYPKDQIALIDKAIADDAAAKAKADAEAKSKAELEAKYQAAVKKGDAAFAKKDWVNAKAGYNEAHALKAAEKYPTDQLALIDKAIADETAAKAKADADAKAKAELEAKYNAALKKGDEAFAKKDWVNARVGYNEALGVKPNEAYPKDKLLAIDKAIADEKSKMDADAKAKAEAELLAKYNAAVKKGDDAFKKKDWTNARVGYNEALGIKPAEKYPTDQLAAIEKAIADEKNKLDADAKAKAEAEVNAKYNAAVKKGDDGFKIKDWVNARVGYNEALGIKPAEKYPKDQLAAIDKAIADGKADAEAKAKADAEAKAKAELDAKYNAAIKKGDDAFKKKDWANARGGYNEALGVKSGEKYPKDQLAAIDKAIEDEKGKMDADAKAKAEAELNAKYNAAIKKGDDAFKKKDWATARGGYNEALGFKPNEKYPKDQLAAIDKAIEDEKGKMDADAKAKAEAELNAKYNAAIKKGDDAFKKKDWTTARGGYNEAIGIKPSEKYPKDQLAAIDKAIEDEKGKMDADAKAKAEAELNAKYAAAIKKGDDAFKKKDWSPAKAAYTEALGFKPNEKYPKDQIAAIDKAMAAIVASNTDKSNDVQYKAAMVRGENDMKFKKWKEAVGAFTEALTYKPNDPIAKAKLAEAQKNASADDVANTPPKKEPHPLSLKYPQGVTEESKSEPGVYITRRILVKGEEAWVYVKKHFNWGGVVFYKDDAVITQTVWDNETK